MPYCYRRSLTDVAGNLAARKTSCHECRIPKELDSQQMFYIQGLLLLIEAATCSLSVQM